MTDNDEVRSPCISWCVMDTARGWCGGCYRTLAEIAGWSEYTADEKRAVLARLPARETLADQPVSATN